MTYYQPLNCSTKNWAKNFFKAKFSTWFWKQVQNHYKGVAIEDIDIKFRLTTMKPLHVNWLTDLHNELMSPWAKDVIIARWKISGIYDTIRLDSSSLPSNDTFAKIEPMDSDNVIKFDIQSVSNNSEYDVTIENENTLLWF